jgi:inhibitor of KinA
MFVLMDDYSIYPIGDQSITFSLGNSIDQQHHAKIMAMKRWFAGHPFAGLRDVVVAYSSLTIIYDVFLVRSIDLSGSASDFVKDKLLEAYRQPVVPDRKGQKLWRIPVCYDTSFSPDLGFLSSHHGISERAVIDLHTSSVYHIYMIGFLPGFPYMAEVDKKIATPRRETPRSRVEEGSVGIAGIQTGIYPITSPGGWQIIGRTPWKLFDKNVDAPVQLEPGDSVQFYSISKEEFYDHTSKNT